MRTDVDWLLLAKLFGDENAPFRHQLSLCKSSAQDFYAPTVEAASIRCGKEAILASAAADQYLIESEEGLPALQEFARLLGCDAENVALALEPDLILVTPPDWRLVWACVCFPTRWSLAGKRLQPLAEIHAIVPALNEELGRKIDVFFSKLTPGGGWGRANWGLSTNAQRNQHPCLPYARLTCETPLEAIYVRLESQHLLKMPATGAIAFGIRILSFPLSEVVARPRIVASLKERLRTMPAEVAAYKGIPTDFWQRV